jgi:hypothetical protein
MKKLLLACEACFPSFNVLMVIGVAVFCLSTCQEVSAQYIQFSSNGTSNNLDSVYNNFAAMNKPQINSSLYRSKASDSLNQQLSQYRGNYDNALRKSKGYTSRYDSTLDRINQYRTKYADPLERLKQLPGSPGRLDKFRKDTRFDERYKKYQQASGKAQSLRDQLLAGKIKLDSNTVFNNRIMRAYTDSLKRTLSNVPTAPPFQEVPKEQLVKEVNNQFQSQADSLRDSRKWIGETHKKKEWVDLNYARLKSADGSDLRPMMTSLVETKVLKHIDSLRIADLKASRTKMEEQERNVREHVAKFREKESFWKKSYLEGVLSMSANPNGSMQLSPAWAYHILPAWSVGGGPNIVINKQSSSMKFDLGARVLTKYEMLHRTVYVQVEDRINPGAIGTENKVFTQHNVMGGGGYVIPFLSPVTLNMAVLYKFYSNGVAENDGSSWVFRIGISSNKKDK